MDKAAGEDTNFCLKKNEQDDKFYLKEDHSYFYQVCLYYFNLGCVPSPLTCRCSVSYFAQREHIATL